MENIDFQRKEYHPTESEFYKALYELSEDGIVQRHKRSQEEKGKGLKEIVIYSFTEDGYGKAQVYKQQVKIDLERSRRIIDSVLADNY